MMLKRLASLRLRWEFLSDLEGLHITTIGGRRVHVFRPAPDMIDLGDIAHSLGMIVRWCGHVSHFYSVAQHSVYAYRLAKRFCEPETLPIVGPISLLHDASEAYMNDLPSPVKAAFKRFPHHEKRLIRAVLGRYDLPWSDEAWSVMKLYDRELLHAESVTLKRHPIQYIDSDGLSYKPDPHRKGLLDLFPDYRPWSPEEAKEKFLIAAQEAGID